MNKFVIFASARTGSTSLSIVLGQSKGVKMAAEPFHPDFTKWNSESVSYKKLLDKTKDLDSTLNKIFRRYTAFKTLHNQLTEVQNLQLLGRKDLKILFLVRRRLFDQIVSDLVAHQVGKWNDTHKDTYKSLKALNPKEMKKKIGYVHRSNNKYLSFLENNKKVTIWSYFTKICIPSAMKTTSRQ